MAPVDIYTSRLITTQPHLTLKLHCSASALHFMQNPQAELSAPHADTRSMRLLATPVRQHISTGRQRQVILPSIMRAKRKMQIGSVGLTGWSCGARLNETLITGLTGALSCVKANSEVEGMSG